MTYVWYICHICLYIHCIFIRDTLRKINCHLFQGPQVRSSRPWQVNPANISEHERWRWDMWKKWLKGIPPCDFGSTGVGDWGLGWQKTGSWRSQKTIEWNESSCLVLYGWHAENEGRHVSGKPCTSLSGFYESIVRFIPFNIPRGLGKRSKCPSKQD